MLSMPPAATSWKSPQRRSLAAIIAARIPEPQTLFRVTAPVATGQPAPRAAWRAGACPWPAVSTHPMLTCSIASGVTPAWAMAAARARAPSACAGSVDKAPWKAPIGVRTALSITTSSMTAPRERCGLQAESGRPPLSTAGRAGRDANTPSRAPSEGLLGTLRAGAGSRGPSAAPRPSLPPFGYQVSSATHCEVPAVGPAATMPLGMVRALGIDFGEKRIGIAVSDPAGRLAVPLTTLARRDDRSVMAAIAEIALREGVGRLVLGEPVSLDGTRGPAAARVRRFGERLAARTALPLTFVDEALTSVE